MNLRRIIRNLCNTLTSANSKQIAVLLLSITFAGAPLANPVLNSVTSGAVTVQQSGNTTTVNQSTQQAIIQWNSFNIAAQEKTQFVQPNASSVALNRINPTQGASQIYGSLSANGKIILVNAAGIHFGPGSMVNVGSLIASTSDISNANFLAGKYIFNIKSPYGGSIINEGTISAANYGLVALLGTSVINRGLIQAQLGSIVLGSGNQFTLDFNGDQLINFTVDQAAASPGVDDNGNPVTTGVSNSGSLLADGGKVLITASAAQGVLDNVIDMQGVARAQSVAEQDGEIILSGGDGDVSVKGTLDASGTATGSTGGTVKVLGNNIVLGSTANINVSGDAGGGNIIIGGDQRGMGPDQNALTTLVSAGSILNASTLTSGNAGNVVVWANNATQFAGSIFANGGTALGSNGGNAETSAENLNISGGYVNLLAANGKTGTWLMDPATVTISGTATTNNSGFAPTANSNTSNIYVGDLTYALATANITVTTTNSGGAGSGTPADISVNSAISWNQATTLTLSAGNFIFINAPITAPLGGLTLQAANLSQSITSGTTASPSSTGVNQAISVANFTLTSGQWYQKNSTLPTLSVSNSFSIASGSINSQFGGVFTRVTGGAGTSGSPYTIADVYGLQGVATMPLSNYYNLANDIDATASRNWTSTYGAGFVPIAGNTDGSLGYSGTIDGQNFAVSNLYINDSSIQSVGLIGNGNNATIKNLGLINPNVSGGSYVGAILGNAQGTNTITNSWVMGGFVQGSGSFIGGINGVGRTNLNQDWSSATVTGSSGASNIGGLVGNNLGFTIQNSYSTGAVNATNGTVVGGLVGENSGSSTIKFSYSTGLVTATNSTSVGGFVGDNSGTIQNSFLDTSTSQKTVAIGTGTQTGVTYGCFSGSGCLSGTAVLNTSATYSSWSIGSGSGTTWYIANGLTRPILESNYSTVISTPEQLQLVNIAPTANYTLGMNVDASATSRTASEWGNTGFYALQSYSGIFNGQSYTNGNVVVQGTISNLYENNNSSYGLFNQMSAGTVQNLGIINANITNTTSGNAGILMGTNSGATVINVYTTGIISGGYTGGLIGTNSSGSVTNVYSTANVTGLFDTGGLIGQLTGGTLKNGFATGTVTGPSAGYSVGGLIGYEPGGSATNVYSTGAVNSTSTGGSIGGLIGYLVGGTVADGYTTSAVTSSSTGSTGAIIGRLSSGSVTNVYADSQFSITSNLIGLANGGTSTGNSFLTDTQMQNGGNYSGFSFYNQANSAATNGNNNPWMMAGYAHLAFENTPTITNLIQLQLVATNPSGNYTLANNIDASATVNWNNGAGFTPIGNSGGAGAYFSGSFNGNGKVISNLYIYEPSATYVGLFSVIVIGPITPTVQNLGVINANITGLNNVGILAGYSNTPTTNNYVTGSVTGNASIGGLIGLQDASATITNSYSNATVTGVGDTGGLVGYNNGGGISLSYSAGNVSGAATTGGSTSVGGLVGFNNGALTNVYSTANVFAMSTATNVAYTGGLTGDQGSGASINGAYASGTITLLTPSTHTGGLTGNNDNTTASIANAFWNDINPVGYTAAVGTGNAASASVTAITTTTQKFAQSTYTGVSGFGSFGTNPGQGVWYSISGSTLPMLQMEYSTNITNVHQLEMMNEALGANYVQTANIDATNTNNADVFGTAGFVPIGYSPNTNYTGFTGNYNGQGFTINNLYENNTASLYAGLFGSATLGSNTIKNVSLTNVNITGQNYTGGLIGELWSGTVQNSFTTGNITGTNANFGTGSGFGVGGLIGQASGGTILNTYSYANVNSPVPNSIGGLIGANFASVNYSYSTGLITTASGSNVGGLIGCACGGSYTSNYWDITSSGQALGINEQTVSNITGYSTSSMVGGSGNFTGWGFSTSNPGSANWFSNGTMPILQMEYNTQISNGYQLELANMNMAASYSLANNINMSGVNSVQDAWGGTGFIPLGGVNNTATFTGTLNGAGHTITNLTLANVGSSANNYGLVDTNGGSIQNLGLTNFYYTPTFSNNSSNLAIGAFTGQNLGQINNVFLTGTFWIVDNTNQIIRMGGIAGANGSVSVPNTNTYYIQNAYNSADLFAGLNGGVYTLGGIVGSNGGNGVINSSYSIGQMVESGGNGTAYFGGFAGENQNVITNSYYNSTTGGLAAAVGNINNNAPTTGITTVTTMSSLMGFSGNASTLTGFTNQATWSVVGNYSIPYLTEFYPVAPRVISGSTPTVNRNISIAANGSIVANQTTFADSTYYMLLGNSEIPNGSPLLIYMSGGSNYANLITVAPKNGAGLTGENLTTNSVKIGDGITNTISNSQINTMLGSITNSTFLLFSASGGNVTIKSSAVVNTSATTTLNLDTGIFTINGGGTLLGSLTGSGVLNIYTGGTTNIGGTSTSNSGYSGGIGLSSVFLNLTGNANIDLLGTGRLYMSGSNITATNAITLPNAIQVTGDTSISPATNNITLNGNVDINNGATLFTRNTGSSTITFGGVFNSTASSSFNGNLTMGQSGDGTGIVSLTGASPNWSGTVLLDGGTVVAGATTNPFGVGALQLKSGTLKTGTASTLGNSGTTIANGSSITLAAGNGAITFTNQITLGNSSSTFIINDSATNTFTGGFTGAGTVDFRTGTQSIGGSNSGWTGPITLEWSTIQINNTNTSPLGTGLITVNAANSTNSDFEGYISSLVSNPTVTNNFSLTTGINLAGTNSMTFSGTFVNGGNLINVSDTGGITFNGIISGTGGLSSAGGVTLGAANTFTGATAISAGTLVLNNANGLGSGSNMSSSIAINGTSALDLNFSGTFGNTKTITLNTSNGGTTGAMYVGGSNVTISNPITLSANTTIGNPNPGGLLFNGDTITAGASTNAGLTFNFTATGVGLALPTINLGGGGSGALSVTASGAITQNGALTVTGASSFSSGNAVTVTNTGNLLTGAVSISTGGNNTGSLYNNMATQIGTVNVGTGTFNVTDNVGNMTQNTGGIVAGTANFTNNSGYISVAANQANGTSYNTIGSFSFNVTGTNNAVLTTTGNTTVAGLTLNGGSEGLNIVAGGTLTYAAGNSALTSSNTIYLGAGSTINLNSNITAGNLTLSAGANSAITTTSSTTGVTATINVGTFNLVQGLWSQTAIDTSQNNPVALPSFFATNFQMNSVLNNNSLVPTNVQFIRANLLATGTAGSSSNPYQITDIYGLQGLGSSTAMLSSYAALVSSFSASGTSSWTNALGTGFTPIGNYTTAFTGNLQGNGKTVSNLTINFNTTNSVLIGLFGNVSNASIANVTLSNPTITGFQWVGALVGNGATSTTTSLTNDFVIGGSVTGVNYVGGLVGVDRMTISNSGSSANVFGINSGTNIGGLVAGIFDANWGISGSYSTGTVSASTSTNVGGFLGYMNTTGTISGSYS
ncbi:MAG: hypothetical protein V4501_12920, partial [Pseudomonadota bacterium]